MFAIVALTAKSQLSYTLPATFPEFDGSYENFGKHHFFYPNKGEIRYADEDQTPAEAEVAFYTKYTYPRQYLLKNNNISFVFAKKDPAADGTKDSLHRIDLQMDRSDPAAFLARVDTQKTAVLNYFTHQTGSSGVTDVRGGAAIAVEKIYPDIDMVYCSNNTGLKIFYVVWPGGDPNRIVLHVNGSKSNAIVGNDLVIDANWSTIKFVKPQMYQYTLINNVVTPFNVCPASWQSSGGDRYKITTTSSWNSSMPLIIQVSQGQETQPNINSLNWSTYYGGGNMDYIFRTNSDANNNLFCAGRTISTDFPQTATATPVQATNIYYDGFLSKFSANGVLLWSTYIGGSGSEWIKDFDFNSGDVYCAGYTSSFDLPVQAKTGAFNDNAFAGGEGDAFIFQLDAATGGTNKWLTYFGGDRWDEFRGCKFDSNGNFFLGGSSSSTNINSMVTGPTGSYQQNFNASQQQAMPNPPVPDCIMAKFDAGTSALSWFTFFGTDVGSVKDDEFWDIDIDGTDVYAVGYAGGTNLPSSLNSKTSGAGTEGIIAKFSNNGALTAVRYSSGNLRNNSVRIFNGNVYVCGLGKNGMTTVNSNSYYFDGTCASGDFDASFSVHPLNLSTTTHNTFIGGTGVDHGMEMQIAPNGVIYIAGETYASNFPNTSIANTYNSSHNGNDDYFIVALQEGNTSIVWSTCLGSPSDETDQQGEACSISLDAQNFLHLGGCSNSYNTFPLDNNGGVSYFQPTRSGSPQSFGSQDATITRFDLVPVNVYVGLKDYKGTISFGLYPNPTAKELVVENVELQNKELHYSVYNIAGQKLMEGTLNTSERKTINVSELNAGVYIINIGNENRMFSNKFIKTDN